MDLRADYCGGWTAWCRAFQPAKQAGSWASARLMGIVGGRDCKGERTKPPGDSPGVIRAVDPTYQGNVRAVGPGGGKGCWWCHSAPQLLSSAEKWVRGKLRQQKPKLCVCVKKSPLENLFFFFFPSELKSYPIWYVNKHSLHIWNFKARICFQKTHAASGHAAYRKSNK